MLKGRLSVSCFLYAHLRSYQKLSQILISVTALQIKISYLTNHEAFLEKVAPVPFFTVNWFQTKEKFSPITNFPFTSQKRQIFLWRRKLLTLVNRGSISLHHAVYYLEHLVSKGSIVDQWNFNPFTARGKCQICLNCERWTIRPRIIYHFKVFSEVCNKWNQQLWRRKLKDWVVSKVKNKKHWNSSFARTYRVYH